MWGFHGEAPQTLILVDFQLFEITFPELSLLAWLVWECPVILVIFPSMSVLPRSEP